MNGINGGERTVQKLYRIGIRDLCMSHDIKEGDKVEIMIKKIERR